MLPPVYSTTAARLQPAGALAGLDHGQGHAVLHASGGIDALDLDQDAGAALRDDAPELEQGRAADALQDRCVDAAVHGLIAIGFACARQSPIACTYI